MTTKKHLMILAVVFPMIASLHAQGQAPIEVSPPQGVTVSIYDTGLGIVNEARRAALPAGESVLLIRDLPSTIDASSITLGTVARSAPFDLLAQEYRYDFTRAQHVLQRLAGQPIVFQHQGAAREGFLISSDDAGVISVRSRDSKDLWMLNLNELSSITFPFSRDLLAPVPESAWRVKARQEGPQNFRISYRAEGLRWQAHYDLLLDARNQQGDLSARVELANESGARFENARIRLLRTEKGAAVPALPDPRTGALQRSPLVYPYGSSQPELEQLAAGMVPLNIYELPRTVTLEPGRPHIVTLVQSTEMPLRRFYVYDGVRFDRFQRNPRSDWNYGTEFSDVVQTHIEFENAEKFGLGADLPSGVCRVYQLRADGSIDQVGESQLLHLGKDTAGSIRVGPAAGLRGERERTGYVEVKPHREYEETFEIRLQNSSDEEAEVRVVEHIYRGTDFEIIRADSEFNKTGPQTIEFRAELKPAARRSIHYTVRYLW